MPTTRRAPCGTRPRTSATRSWPGMEIVLERLTRTVQSGRAKLAAAPAPAPWRQRRSRQGGGGRLFRPGRVLMAGDPFLVHVARLRHAPGATAREVRRGPVVLAGPLDELGIDPGRSVVPLDAEAECDITLRAFSGGIDAVGTVSAPLGGHLPALYHPGDGRAHASRSASGSATRRSPRTSCTRSSTTPSTSARWCATPSCSSCPWPRCAGRTAGGSARTAVPTATRPSAAALPPPDPRWANLDVLR